MLGWIWKVLPRGYKWEVAIKKVSYTVAKVGIGFLAGSAIGKKLQPEHLAAVEAVSGALVAGGLTYVHDWLQVKYPEARWL